jgi:succinate dehydrogenase / fumarate reductase, membrane anchor subunit
MFTKLMALKSELTNTPTKHWLMQRVTAVILIPLTFQLVVFLNLCMTAPYDQTLVWLKSPWHTLCIELWILLTCYHAALGLQVVIEDYVANKSMQLMLIKAINMIFLFLAVAALFFIFRIF